MSTLINHTHAHTGGESSRTFDSEAAAVEAVEKEGCKAPTASSSSSLNSPAWSSAMATGVMAANESAAAAAAQSGGGASQSASAGGGCCGGGCQA
jgi:hypothetical protein